MEMMLKRYVCMGEAEKCFSKAREQGLEEYGRLLWKQWVAIDLDT
jgi:hypothetical protein